MFFLQKRQALKYIIIVAFFVLCLLVNGYNFSTGNHHWQIPFIFKIISPNVYQDDLIFSFPYNNTFYYIIISKIVKNFGLEILIFFTLLGLSFVIYFYDIFFV